MADALHVPVCGYDRLGEPARPNMGAGVPRAGDNIFLFASRQGQASQRFRVYQRGESLPDPSFPDTETRSSQPLLLALTLCPHLPPRQQIRHARPAQRTAARGASLYTGDASLGRRVALWQRANGDPACGGTSDGGRAARRVALRAGTRWTTRAARTVREHRRVRSGSIQS